MAKQGTSILTALRGKKLVFQGKFDYGQEDSLRGMAEAQGGTIVDEPDASTNYLVLADILGGKTIQKKVASLNAKGATIQTLDVAGLKALVQLTDEQVVQLIRGGKGNADLLMKALGRWVGRYGHQQLPADFTIRSEKFDGVDLSGFFFNHIHFQHCSFIGATASAQCNFTAATDCDFSNATLVDGKFDDVDRSRFRGGNFSKSGFRGALDNADFSNATLHGAVFGEYYMHGRTRPGHNHTGILFNRAAMNSAQFNAIALKNPDFDGADLTSAQAQKCNFESATFRSANLEGSVWNGCKLIGADFSGANLCDVDFGDSDLSGACFDGANLQGAHLNDATRTGCDFSKAKNYNPAAATVAVAGPALAELDSVVKQARRVQFTCEVEHATDGKTETIGLDSRGLKYGWGLRTPALLHAAIPRQPGRSASTALLKLGSRLGKWKIRYETLDVTSTKSPKGGKELREIVLNALAEASGQPLPAAEVLAAAIKAHRAESEEQRAVNRERLKKARELEEKQAATAKKQIAKKIAKEVGQVTDIATFLKALELRADKSKIDKATKMLKAEKFQLFNDITETHLNGVVKSQTDPDLVYACRIESNGHYACCTQNLNICGGLRGSICKHLLVLIIGLVKAGQLDPGDIDRWIAKTHDIKAELNKETMGEIFIRYKGAEAGEVDWRPTETVPEDYYAV